MYKLRLKTLSYLLLSCFVITSCIASASGSIESTTVASENMASLSLQGFANCGKVLCWNGIIPGITSLADATSIIEGIYGQDAMSINQQSIEWEMHVSDNIEGGSIVSDTSDIVTEVRIYIPAENVAISEVTEWIGEPELVYVARAFSSEIRCAGSFVTYPHLGVIISLVPENDAIGISPTQFVSGITLVRSENMQDWMITDHWVVAWQGYIDYCAITGQ